MSIRERIGSTFYNILLNAHRRAGGQYFALPENLLKQLVTLERSGRIRISSCAQREESHPRTKGVPPENQPSPRHFVSIPAHTLSMTGTQPFPDKSPAVSTQAASLFPAGTLPIDFRGGPFTHSTAGMLRGIKSGLE